LENLSLSQKTLRPLVSQHGHEPGGDGLALAVRRCCTCISSSGSLMVTPARCFTCIWTAVLGCV